MNIRRAKTVYVKELTAILRDHRTLIAMIVVPIILYPLLMLGSIQAINIKSGNFEQQKITIGFRNNPEWEGVIAPIFEAERDILRRQRFEAENRGADPEEVANIPTPIAELVIPLATPKLEDAIRQGRVHCAIVVLDPVESEQKAPPHIRQVRLRLLMQPEDIHSQLAAERVEQAFARVGEHIVDDTLRHFNIDRRAIEPILLDKKIVTTTGSVLGLVLPLILVLMTITGAIYPAIDLTAGERERGTLEALMVCPVPTIDLVVGKFMVVTTIAMIGATLNLASVTATMFLGGLEEAIGLDAVEGGGGFPFHVLPVVLFCLVPFAILMSAVMIAVCCCARTFKEAQNYIMPVILLVLVPGGLAALPGTRLEGTMVVMPVANMVLLTRELLSGTNVDGGVFIWILLSTSLYAAVAVAIAAHLFGRETVVFADAMSLKSLFSRRLMRHRTAPGASAAALYAAILFPIWFYAQALLQRSGAEDMVRVFHGTTVLMPVFFLIIPWLGLWYWKTDAAGTFRVKVPPARYVISAIFLGCGAWALAHEVLVFQEFYVAEPPKQSDLDKSVNAALQSMSVPMLFLTLAVAPAVCEEIFFRGFLLSGLRRAMRPWPAILLSAAAFGAFHFFIFRFPITMGLGVILGWLCVKSGSIWPSIILHTLHNGVVALGAVWSDWNDIIGRDDTDPWVSLPATTLIPAAGFVLIGMILLIGDSRAYDLIDEATTAVDTP